MTLKEIRKIIDNTKVYVNGKSRKIQKKLFSFGYTWPGNDPTKVDCEDKPFLFIHKEGYISYGDDMNFFKEHKNKEISADEILSLEITEPSYRPFKNKDECWQEMIKHQPFGWIILKGGKHPDSKAFIIKLTENCFYYIGDGGSATYNLYDYEFEKHFWLFADGTPFGIKED